MQPDGKREIGQLKATSDQLQKDNDWLRQELLAARATPGPSKPSSSSSGSIARSGLTDREQALRLEADNNWIRNERKALREENARLENTLA